MATLSEMKEDSIELAKTEEDVTDSEDYAHGSRLTALVISLMLGMFLVALDNVRSHSLLRSDQGADQSRD